MLKFQQNLFVTSLDHVYSTKEDDDVSVKTTTTTTTPLFALYIYIYTDIDKKREKIIFCLYLVKPGGEIILRFSSQFSRS